MFLDVPSLVTLVQYIIVLLGFLEDFSECRSWKDGKDHDDARALGVANIYLLFIFNSSGDEPQGSLQCDVTELSLQQVSTPKRASIELNSINI